MIMKRSLLCIIAFTICIFHFVPSAFAQDISLEANVRYVEITSFSNISDTFTFQTTFGVNSVYEWGDRVNCRLWLLDQGQYTPIAAWGKGLTPGCGTQGLYGGDGETDWDGSVGGPTSFTEIRTIDHSVYGSLDYCIFSQQVTVNNIPPLSENAHFIMKGIYEPNATSVNSSIYGHIFPSGKVWNVDNDGTDYPNPDFNEIQTAINSVLPGDTLLVHPGTYNDNIIINKSISIISTTGYKHTAIIPASNTAATVSITVPQVTLSGFSIEDTTINGIAILNSNNVEVSYNRLRNHTQNAIYSSSSHTLNISHNFFSNNYDSIYIQTSTPNTILDNNQLLNNTHYGIFLASGNNITISSNRIDQGSLGLYLRGSACTIKNNTITRTTHSGIYFDKAATSKIQNNNIQNNLHYGIILYYSSNNNTLTSNLIENNVKGLFIQESSHNLITQNEFNNNEENLLFYGHNEIDYVNTFTDNTINGLPFYYLVSIDNQDIEVGNSSFISLINCENITINNAIVSHNDAGILIAYSNNCTIMNSHSSHSHYGVHILESDKITLNNVTLLNNEIGVYIIDSNRNTIIKCNLTGNDLGIHSSDSNTIQQNNNIITENIFQDNFNALFFTKMDEGIISHNTMLGEGGLLLSEVTNYNISDNTISSNSTAINIQLSEKNHVYNNNIYDSPYGIYLNVVMNSTIINNQLYQNENSLTIKKSNQNQITHNKIHNNQIGVEIRDNSNGNQLYFNEFNNNSEQCRIESTNNTWNSQTPIYYWYNNTVHYGQLGNYWSGQNYNDSDKNGVSDTPYQIETEQDTYPLVYPIDEYQQATRPAPADLLLSGNQVLTLENCVYIQTGNVLINETATLHLRNCHLILNQTTPQQYKIQSSNHANIIMEENSIITTNYGGRIHLEDNSTGTIIQSSISTLKMELFGNSNLYVRDSQVNYVGVYGSSNATIVNSRMTDSIYSVGGSTNLQNITLNRLGVSFHLSDTEITLNQLPTGNVHAWSLKQNNTAASSKQKLILRDVEVPNWYINAVGTNLTLTIKDSELMGTGFWGEVTALLVNTTIKYWDQVYDNCTKYTGWYLELTTYINHEPREGLPIEINPTPYPDLKPQLDTGPNGTLSIILWMSKTNNTGEYPYNNYTISTEYLWVSAQTEINMTTNHETSLYLTLNTSDSLTLELSQGWNLIGTPFTAQPIETLFNQNLAYIDTIFSYDQGWKHWINNAPSTLTYIGNGLGYWVHTNTDFNLTITGEYTQPSTLNSGWNLITHVEPNPVTITQYLEGHIWTSLFTYDQEWKYAFPDIPGTLTSLDTGKGYWILTNEE